MRKIKYLLLLPLTAITSCGYSASYLVEGNKYVSSVFKENYYTHWDNELKNASKEEAVNVTDKKIIAEQNYQYDLSTHYLHGLEDIDPNFFAEAPDVDEYGEEYKMNSLDDSFRYGYQSKLFDGQMVCGGQNGKDEYAQAKGRVQIQESGISIRFSKEGAELHYFAMQFKASTDNTAKDETGHNYKADGTEAHGDEDLFHESKLQLTITLYTKVGTSIVGHPFLVDIDLTGQVQQGVDIHGDPKMVNKTNNGHVYTFLAFDLEEYDLVRCVGVSVEFKVVEDHLLDVNKEKGVDMTYALFLYELFLPYTRWN